MNINLHIERLVLDGLSIGNGQGTLVKAAVEAELTRLLATNGLGPEFQAGRAVASVRTEGIQLAKDGSPADLGGQIAQAVYGGLRR